MVHDEVFYALRFPAIPKAVRDELNSTRSLLPRVQVRWLVVALLAVTLEDAARGTVEPAAAPTTIAPTARGGDGEFSSSEGKPKGVHTNWVFAIGIFANPDRGAKIRRFPRWVVVRCILLD